MSIPFKYPEQAILVPIGMLDTSNRSRVEYGNLQEFGEQIVASGYLIHPPTVTRRQDGKYTLIAGGRRTAAMVMLGLTEIPVVCLEDMPLSKIVELEGEENFRRLDMNWHEKVYIICRAHELKQAEADASASSWGMKDTGALLGVSVASVSHAYQIRVYLQKDDKEILDAPSLKAAYEILLKRKENEAIRLTSAITSVPSNLITPGAVGNINTDAMLDAMLSNVTFDSGEEDCSDTVISLESLMAPEERKDAPIILEVKDFPISKMFFNGDFREVIANFQNESVDHVVTDIPYGIDLDNMDRIKDIDTVVNTHHVEQNVEMMPVFLREAYRVLKPNGYCVFWYDLDHHEKLHAWAKEVGFSAQRWPLVWHKLHPCINNAATKNFTKNVEFAMVLRKGNAVLNKAQSTCVVAADHTVERKMYDNPFAKPAAVWRFIHNAIAYKGQTTLDPFGGQFSQALAAIDDGLTPIVIEIDPDHFLKGVNTFKNKVKVITNGSATFS